MAVINQPVDGEDEQMLELDQEISEAMLELDQEVPEARESMEVQLENATTVEPEKDYEPKANRFTWVIEEFSKLSTRRHYSDVFRAGGCNWRVLLFPRGNNRHDYLSMFVDCADASELPLGWSRTVQFSITLVNQSDASRSINKDAMQNFNASTNDWGFGDFMRLQEFYNPSAGFIVNDTCIIIADVAVRRIVNSWLYNSKKETGYVGLKNQGATCYMNSLLQTLFHIPYFRKAVYHMPTTETASSGTIAWALQNLFYKLQYNDKSVATKALTKAFGWNSYDAFMQHDVQELNRVLCEKLENKMKGTVVEGTIGKLFEGHLMNYIECINVDMKSTRKESFYDLQLDVKGCCDVYASFDKYVEVERLEGDNKYHAEEHGLQDAKKGILFTDFPPVLQLHLKRFEYDFSSDVMVKINDRYEFPLELDLDRENGKYLSPDADRTVRNLYTLHSILVHSGGVHGGHYYAYINPTLSDQWFKFDDERVTKEDIKSALEEQYGGEEKLPEPELSLKFSPVKFTRVSSAYMLVYVRQSDKEKILCDVGEKEIPDHLKLKFREEQEEKENRKKCKEEASLYTNIKVISDEDLKEQIGRDVHFDLVDFQKVRTYRVKRQTLLTEFKEEVAKDLDIFPEFLRFWIWTDRQNYTERPKSAVDASEELNTIDEVKAMAHVAYNEDLKLFLEIEFGPDTFPISPPRIARQDILLFFKLYDPEEENVRYLGRLFVKISSTPAEISSKLNRMCGYARDEKLQFVEELSYKPRLLCKRIDDKATFLQSKLENGDIICVQKLSTGGMDEDFRCPDVQSFFLYLLQKQIVHFRSLEHPKEDGFSLELMKPHTYDEVVEKLADHIGLEDPSRIRLTGHNVSTQQARPIPFGYRPRVTLSNMLVCGTQLTDILYYEVLDIPYPELLLAKVLNIGFYDAAKNEVTSHTFRIQKNKTVQDLLLELETRYIMEQVKLSDSEVELRLLGIHHNRIYRKFSPSTTVEELDSYEAMKYSLRAEVIPAAEKNRSSTDRLIHVYHYMEFKENLVTKNFGEPFLFVVYEGETLAQLKQRIQNRLQVPDDDFSKWKFAHVHFGRLHYLQDNEIVLEYFKGKFIYGEWEQYIGLEHTDTTKKKASTPNYHSRSAPFRIYN